MARKKVVKKKLEIVFDEKKRRDFLTGFQKRKNERKKRAKDELVKNLKEERKKIRQEVREGFKYMKKSFEPLRELTEQDKVNEDEYEDDDVKVKIVELSSHDLASQKNFLGENRVDDDESEDESADTSDAEENDTNCIPGMDFDINKKKRKRADNDDTNDADDANKEADRKKNKFAIDVTDLKSKKDLDRLKKNKTIKKIKKSKPFQIKERIDKTANQKKTRRDRNNMLRSLPKNQRKKKKYAPPSRYSKGRLMTKKEFRKKHSPRD